MNKLPVMFMPAMPTLTPLVEFVGGVGHSSTYIWLFHWNPLYPWRSCLRPRCKGLRGTYSATKDSVRVTMATGSTL